MFLQTLAMFAHRQHLLSFRGKFLGMEPVYGTLITAARTLWAIEGLTFTMTGEENLLDAGGAVIAINHTGYLDFTYAGYPTFKQKKGRKIRFMAKKEVFDNKISGPLMRGCRHIPVDRTDGASSYQMAVDYLKSGELVGVYPEATISRSFEIKDFKSGAARMALEAQVPIVPHVVWGAQRVWTKGYPKQLGRTNTPIAISVGKPIEPVGTAEQITEKLRTAMIAQLAEIQKTYVHPAGEFWVPARLGGSAPTLAEATALDEQEQAERMKRREEAKNQSEDKGKPKGE